jgi:hypothetical protein
MTVNVYLTPRDLNRESQGKPIQKVDRQDFSYGALGLDLFQLADLVIYTDAKGEAKVLKSRT